MKTKLLRKIRKRFTVIDYKFKKGYQTFQIKYVDHKTKEVHYQYSLFGFLYNAIPNYMELRYLRSYNRELRKLNKL